MSVTVLRQSRFLSVLLALFVLLQPFSLVFHTSSLSASTDASALRTAGSTPDTGHDPAHCDLCRSTNTRTGFVPTEYDLDGIVVNTTRYVSLVEPLALTLHAQRRGFLSRAPPV